ncbi:hypothetical protein EPI10_031699 [Gossypium australe]|uniref:Uncharacterized protein n=1 Tax=Gossypium australe TaxID=47621 RepID=A0A5B6X2B2_9ROSI|nr:hypothetical protein EPI10_031699 [Gossypium australe]
MASKSSSVQVSKRKNFSKTSSAVSVGAYVMKAKEDADLPEGLSLEIECSEMNVLVMSPFSQITVVNKLIRNCVLVVGEHVIFGTFYC